MRIREMLSYMSSALGIGLGTVNTITDVTPQETILNIILLVLSICSVVITTVIVVIGAIKKAKANDGKVTLDEIPNIVEPIINGVNQVEEIIETNKKNKVKK